MIRKIFSIFAVCLLCADFAFAQVTDPGDLSFKRVRRNKNRAFTAANGCALLTNDDSQTVSKITIASNGSRIRLPKTERKKNLKVNSIDGLQKNYKWWACGSVNDVVGLYAKTKANSTPVQVNVSFSDFIDLPTSNGGPTCNRNYGNKDGTGSWVWKPISDGNRKLVVLLPSRQGSSKMILFSSKGKKLEKLSYTGRTNGNRPTFRGRKPGRSYPKNLYVQYQLGNVKACRRIPNPGNRYD